jgi:hypothetical protein
METNHGLEERQPLCNCSKAESGRDRTHVRTFIDRSLYFGSWRRNGNSGASRSKRESHDFRHDERQRQDLQGLVLEIRSVDRLSPQLTEKLQRDV